MIRVSACLFCHPLDNPLTGGVTLHPIESDGDGGFFYARSPQYSLGGFSLLHCIARVTRKEYAYGRFS